MWEVSIEMDAKALGSQQRDTNRICLNSRYGSPKDKSTSSNSRYGYPKGMN